LAAAFTLLMTGLPIFIDVSCRARFSERKLPQATLSREVACACASGTGNGLSR
jgi:hypothetical protein